MNELANFLTDLTTTTLNLTTNLAYGYGNLATKEINNLRDLLSEAEGMIPVIETEACMAEAEELDREERSFNYWMTMLYGSNSVSPVDTHNINKANRLKRRKANIRHHKTDRKHGKTVPQSDKKYWDEQSGTFYRWDEKRKTFHSHKKPVIHRKRKTFRDRLEFAAKEREIDFLSAMEICDRSNIIYFRGVKETNPIRKEQLMDIASDLLNAGCVDFYHGAVTGHKGTYFPDLAIGN